jgi:hypothetical protein
MFYFVYCTYLDEPELRRYAPTAHFVTKAKVVNHKVEFRAVKGRNDRGWCHLSDVGDALGEVVYGLVYTFSEAESMADFDDFERCFLTVLGDDGKVYDCFTYRLIEPGDAMRPPDYYWQHIPKGAAEWNLPPEYQAKLRKTYDEALPCPHANRPKPAGKPGKSAETR